MSRHEFEPHKRIIQRDGIEVTFRPWDADDYLRAFVKGDPDDPDADKYNMDIVVVENGEESYYHHAMTKMSASAYEQFVTKFLTDPKSRKKMLQDGKGWDGVISVEKHKIHPKCAVGIKRIETTKESKLHFRDFAALKTFGQDEFSRKKISELEEIVGEEKIGEIKQDERMEDESLYVLALRWTARGLSPNHAVRKVMTDKEISENARGNRY